MRAWAVGDLRVQAQVIRTVGELDLLFDRGASWAVLEDRQERGVLVLAPGDTCKGGLGPEAATRPGPRGPAWRAAEAEYIRAAPEQPSGVE